MKVLNSKEYNKNNINPTSDYLFRVLLLGDSGVGKSSIILRYSVSIVNIHIIFI